MKIPLRISSAVIRATPPASPKNAINDEVAGLISAKENYARELLGQHYDPRLATPEENIIAAINKGFFPTGPKITFGPEYNFDLRNRHIDMPDNVTMKGASLISGSMSIRHGTLYLYGAKTVGCAAGNDATVIACTAGAIAVAAAARAIAKAIVAGAKAYAIVAFAYAFAGAKGAFAFETAFGAFASGTNGGTARNFEFVKMYFHELKDAADSGDLNKAHEYGTYGITNLYPSIISLQTSSLYFLRASESGHALSSYNIGNRHLTGNILTKQNLLQAEKYFQYPEEPDDDLIQAGQNVQCQSQLEDDLKQIDAYFHSQSKQYENSTLVNHRFQQQSQRDERVKLAEKNLQRAHQQDEHIKLADQYFQRAYQQDKKMVDPLAVGDQFLPFSNKVVSTGQGLKTGASIAHNWHRKAAENGDVVARRRVAAYKASSFNFDKVLFGIETKS